MNVRQAKIPHLYYGGDYNPEQWSEHVWLQDMRLMKKAGVNLVSIGIFSWALLQPNKDTYDFEWLDRLMDLLVEHGIYADLSTATTAPPAWMSVQFPDTLPVDENGVRYRHGSRQHYCPNSSVYRNYGQKLVRKLAERYQHHPALAMWHVNNEYACHISRCYCEQCVAVFQEWLQKRYDNIEELNARWGTNFWSQKYYDWAEIGAPVKLPTFANPGQELDYARFMSDSILECYMGEQHILKEITPNISIVTNFTFKCKPLDYFKWAKNLDIITWDNYPESLSGIPIEAAMWHDLMRSLKDGQPFIVMEQATSHVNWFPYNPAKRPGIMRLWSYQALAHGADGILFFQWRASQAGAEKFLSGMVSHSGDENSRVYREVEKLGNELKRLDVITDARIKAKVAIVFDWHNWWALELESKPSKDVRYCEQIMNFYIPLFKENIAVDFVHTTGDLSPYQVVIAPVLYMIEPGVAEKLEKFVAAGGIFITTFFSGMVDENDRVHLGGYPAPLRNLLGICVEEFDAMLPQNRNGILVNGIEGVQGEHECSLWADVIRLEGAEALAVFTSDYFAGSPAITENKFGKGKAIYIGTQATESVNRYLLKDILTQSGIEGLLSVPEGVEVTCREKDGVKYLFILNHLPEEAYVHLPGGQYTDIISGKIYESILELPANEVFILKKGC